MKYLSECFMTNCLGTIFMCNCSACGLLHQSCDECGLQTCVLCDGALI